MSSAPLPTNPIIIPNLPVGKIVDEDGNPTDEELQFRQQLITTLQSIVGPEGLIAPSQTAANITTIATNTVQNPSNPLTTVYTAQYGTIIYESDAGSPDTSMKVIVNDGTNVPVIKTFTLS